MITVFLADDHQLFRQGLRTLLKEESFDLLVDGIQTVAEGMTNQEIAAKLCISASTVDTHRKNIMGKLDIHSVAGLVKYPIRHKIVTL